MGSELRYAHKILLTLIGSTKELQKKTLSALYEMGTEGDFERTENLRVDKILEKLSEDKEMPDIIGDVERILRKKIQRHLSKNTKN